MKSGESLGDYAAHALFAPAGMNSSFIYEDRYKVIPHRATGYSGGALRSGKSEGEKSGSGGYFVDTMVRILHSK